MEGMAAKEEDIKAEESVKNEAGEEGKEDDGKDTDSQTDTWECCAKNALR